MDDEKREMLREVCVKEFGGKDGKEAMDDETKVRQLFSSFMNKKTGRIGFEEAKDYTIMTEGDKAVLHLDMWTFVCKYAWKDASGFKNYDPKLGLNYLEFRKTFLDKDTAGLLETDLNHDYKAFVSFVRGGRDEKESDKKGTNSTSFDDK
eukprot:g4495.t1